MNFQIFMLDFKKAPPVLLQAHRKHPASRQHTINAIVLLIMLISPMYKIIPRISA